MGFFGNNCGNNDSWLWVLIIIVLIVCSCDGSIFGGNCNNCCDNNCGCDNNGCC